MPRDTPVAGPRNTRSLQLRRAGSDAAHSHEEPFDETFDVVSRDDFRKQLVCANTSIRFSFNAAVHRMNNHCIRKSTPDGTVTTFAK